MWIHSGVNILANYFSKETLACHFWVTLVCNQENFDSELEHRCSNSTLQPKVVAVSSG